MILAKADMPIAARYASLAAGARRATDLAHASRPSTT